MSAVFVFNIWDIIEIGIILLMFVYFLCKKR
jgi:hypothetical protein